MRAELLLCLNVVLFLITLYALYWIIRVAVRHGIADADERRALEQFQQRQQVQQHDED